MKTVLIVALVVAGVVALAMLLMPSGPRVTQITHTRDDDEERD